MTLQNPALIQMRFGSSSAPQRFLGQGWSHPEPNQTWAVGDESWVMLPCDGIEGDCFLTMQVVPHIQVGLLTQQRLSLHINGSFAASFTVDRPMSISTRIPASMVARKAAICLRLVHPDNASPSDFPAPRHPDRRKLAIAYTELNIAELGADVQTLMEEIEIALGQDCTEPMAGAFATTPPSPDHLAEIFTDFQSIGDDCEFGMMQRRVAQGGDLGLFRFSSVSLNALISGLLCDFSDIATGSNLILLNETNQRREFIGLETKYGMRYHTGRVYGEIDADALKTKETKRLRFLARKLMEDIRGGHKLLVIKRKAPFALEEVARLLAVVRNVGPSTILWIAEAEPGRPAGTVEWITQDLMRGYLEWIAVPPLQNTDLASWMKVCANAHQMWRDHRNAYTHQRKSA